MAILIAALEAERHFDRLARLGEIAPPDQEPGTAGHGTEQMGDGAAPAGSRRADVDGRDLQIEPPLEMLMDRLLADDLAANGAEPGGDEDVDAALRRVIPPLVREPLTWTSVRPAAAPTRLPGARPVAPADAMDARRALRALL